MNVVRLLLLLCITHAGFCQWIYGPTNAPVLKPPAPASASKSESSKPETKSEMPVPPKPAAAPATVPRPVGPSIPARKLTPADLTPIKAGMKRDEVIALLGAPSSKTTVPDEGHLMEVYRYQSGNTWLATIRLDNGSVVTVETNREQP